MTLQRLSTAVAVGAILLLCLDARAGSVRDQVEADWLKQAAAELGSGGRAAKVTTAADAAGACDGVKNGRYGFHTAAEKAPWWQVDLGSVTTVARIVVYNRLDYLPGLHNADHLVVLTSGDGKTWALGHDNQGRHFGGVKGAKPLEVTFPGESLRTRFVRLQVRGAKPLYFHLDEVEVYGSAEPKRNLALGRPADQSSLSQWSIAKVRPTPAGPTAYPVRQAIGRGRRLAEALETAGVDTAACRRELDELASQLEKTGPGRAMYLKARRAVRRLVFRNPLLGFDRLLFVKRHTQQAYPDVCLNHMPWVSRPGGDICVLASARPDVNLSAALGRLSDVSVRNILNGALGPGHVHGMDLWWAADRIVFGYAKSKTADPPRGWLDRRTSYHLRRTEEPTHLFEIGVDPGAPGRVRQLTRGQWSDLDPTYLPNGGIAFASERCAYSLQCNELDKDETSCNLYVMRGDGSRIRRLSASKDGDYLPHTLDDGTIGYTRWEYQERGWAHIQSIWTVRPDGTWADALFKQHLNNPWALEDVRSVPRSHKLVAIATGHHTLAVGPVVVIDPAVGMNSSEGIHIVTPGVRPPEGGMSGRPVASGGVADAGGLYATPWALSEKFFLVSYNYGKQTDPAGYALYLIDVFGNKELIYRDTSISCFIPIPLRPRRRPPILTDVTDPRIPFATCTVSQVSLGVRGVARERIKHIRISQRMPWPYDNVRGGQRYEPDAKGARNWTPARVIGTVPVEPDGSAHFTVPVDTPVYFQLLDADHMELRRMRSFISFQPGEVRGCVGCHESRAEAAAASTRTPAALRRKPSVPKPPPWGSRVLSFLRDVQPVLDHHCVRCHRGRKPPAGLDLGGGLTPRHNRAFDSLVDPRRRLVSCSNVHEDARITQPLAFGSHKSKLITVLRGKSHAKRVKLSGEDWLRLITWIDLNAPYHDAFINKRPARPPYNLATDRQLAARLDAVHAKRCTTCHKPADVSRPDWIDLQKADKSLFLTAPLAKSAGGTGTCRDVYRDRSDPDYQAVLQAVTAAVRAAWDRPRRDLNALQ